MRSLVRGMRLNSFCPEVYTFMRGLERTLSTPRDTVTVVRKHSSLQEGLEGSDPMPSIEGENSFEEQARFQQVKTEIQIDLQEGRTSPKNWDVCGEKNEGHI